MKCICGEKNNIIRAGKTRDGLQRYQCTTCGKYTQDHVKFTTESSTPEKEDNYGALAILFVILLIFGLVFYAFIDGLQYKDKLETLKEETCAQKGMEYVPGDQGAYYSCYDPNKGLVNTYKLCKPD